MVPVGWGGDDRWRLQRLGPVRRALWAAVTSPAVSASFLALVAVGTFARGVLWLSVTGPGGARHCIQPTLVGLPLRALALLASATFHAIAPRLVTSARQRRFLRQLFLTEMFFLSLTLIVAVGTIAAQLSRHVSGSRDGGGRGGGGWGAHRAAPAQPARPPLDPNVVCGDRLPPGVHTFLGSAPSSLPAPEGLTDGNTRPNTPRPPATPPPPSRCTQGVGQDALPEGVPDPRCAATLGERFQFRQTPFYGMAASPTLVSAALWHWRTRQFARPRDLDGLSAEWMRLSLGLTFAAAMVAGWTVLAFTLLFVSRPQELPALALGEYDAVFWWADAARRQVDALLSGSAAPSRAEVAAFVEQTERTSRPPAYLVYAKAGGDGSLPTEWTSPEMEEGRPAVLFKVEDERGVFVFCVDRVMSVTIAHDTILTVVVILTFATTVLLSARSLDAVLVSPLQRLHHALRKAAGLLDRTGHVVAPASPGSSTTAEGRESGVWRDGEGLWAPGALGPGALPRLGDATQRILALVARAAQAGGQRHSDTGHFTHQALHDEMSVVALAEAMDAVPGGRGGHADGGGGGTATGEGGTTATGKGARGRRRGLGQGPGACPIRRKPGGAGPPGRTPSGARRSAVRSAWSSPRGS